jgi:hypothetical protein
MNEKVTTEKEIHAAYLNKFKGKLYGLLCEREKNNPNWERFLDNIMIELIGFPEEYRTINYETILIKLGTCRYLRFQYFRTTILECMNLIGVMEE